MQRLPKFTVSVKIKLEKQLYILQFMLLLQAMNLLIVNQSCIDLLASIILLLWSTIPVTGFPMSNSSLRDQFVCHLWLSRFLLWALLLSSTYSVLAITIERFVAIVHPVIHKVHVMMLRLLWFTCRALSRPSRDQLVVRKHLYSSIHIGVTV